MPSIPPLANRIATAGAVVVLGLFVAQWGTFLAGGGSANIGPDYDLYMQATSRWLAGGGFYLPHQVAGPYPVEHGDILYPPTLLLLLLPFQALPAFLWYAIPIGITAAVVLWWRPSGLAWLGVAACLWFPVTGVKLLHGNPGLWITGAIALATRWPAAGPLVLLKPTAAPFALIGINRRAWWFGLGAAAVASLLFLPMWPDYVRVLLNSRAAGGITYSVNEFPMLAIPVVAWLGRTRGRRSPGARTGPALARAAQA